MQRLKSRLLPLYAFMMWTVKTLNLPNFGKIRKAIEKCLYY